MHSVLLQAKFHRPSAPVAVVERPTLLRRMEEGLHGKVTLVSAPAGFGKSTVVSLWLDKLSNQTAVSDPACALRIGWLSLEEADNQLPRFVRYLIAIVEAQYPQSCATASALLNAKDLPTIEVLADVLGNALTQLPARLMLVLDDLHLVDDAGVYAFLTRLIQRTTNRLHLVLITRVDPPLPLSRWRAQGQLNELRLNDLGFTLAETTSFLGKNLERVPDVDLIALLHQRTEGWVVGLRLAALALRDQRDYAAFVANMKATSTRYIIDYLVDDVLEQQPAGVQQFLTSTAILTRFCAGLCAALLEIDELAAQQTIDEMARANLFLIELSTPANWYRYHHQFQSMLLSRLYERYDSQAIELMHRQAAGWLAAQGQVEEALRHLTAIPDFGAVADLIESQRITALNAQRFYELEEWLALLPAPLLNQRPALLLSLAWVKHYWLEYAQCLATTQRAAALLHEQIATSSEGTEQLFQAEVVALRASTDATLDQAETLAQIQQVWMRLRPQVAVAHSFVVVWLAAMCQRLGQLELAAEIAHTTIEEALEWPEIARARVRFSHGLNYYYECDLTQAERVLLENLRLARQHQWPLIAALSHFRLASIARLRNQQELAEQYYLEVVKEPHHHNGRLAVPSIHRLIEFYASQGRPEASRPFVEQFKVHALMVGRTYLLDQVAALEAYAALRCGDLAAALRWALTGPRSKINYPADRVPLIRAEIFLAEGSPASLNEASQLLEELLGRHEAERSWPMWLDTTALLVVAWDRLGERELALAVLGRAVQRAVPNGIVGPFVEEGQPMLRLLHELRKRPEYADLIGLLLAAFPPDPTAPAPVVPSQNMPEPLTDRELEILRLLADRLSNKEIAQRLIVSIHTVRNHAANIYGKLGVTDRREAVAKAHSLGLLSTNSDIPLD